MAILFISSLVPDEKRFQTASFTRSGNNVLMGIAKSLDKDNHPAFLSMRPVPSFPNGKLWIHGETTMLESGEKILILPTLNIKLVKNYFWNILCFFYVLYWSFINRGEHRDILVYNIYIPSISSLYKACRLSKSKLFAILYDLGVPPKRLGLSKITMFGYRIGERIATKYIPKIDGRIIINENIADHYAPSNDYILVDGGINDDVVKKLFPLRISKTNVYTFVLAGMLWDQNGTKLLLDALKLCPYLNVKIIFAGNGIDVPLIKEAAVCDSRINYMGMLTMEQLFKVYENADVLLNLRLEEEVDFHFPSKLLEYMVTGKYVISTSIAHAEREYGEFMSILSDITPQGLANLMIETVEMGKYALYEKGVKARAYMLNSRSWKFQTKRIEEYIKSKH